MRIFILLGLFIFTPALYAQEIHQDLLETVKAEVLLIVGEETRDIIGTDAEALVQEVRVRIEDGVRRGDTVTLEQDLVKLKAGDAIYVNRLVTIGGEEYFEFKDADRSGSLIFLGVLFVGVLILFSGLQGVRALIALICSVLIILLVMVPLLLEGHSPILVSVPVAGAILAVVLFITYGVKAHSVIALLGTFGAVLVTGVLATLWVEIASLTGLSSDEAIFLNFSTKGALDFGGLLLASIIIGILGVLDDISITQASVVRELKRANGALSSLELYTRALRVGRDHVGSLVNTLALAYVGAALPLVLLLAKAGSSLTLSLNQELVAVELIRIGIGSIGLILAVPFTTAIAAWWWGRYASIEDTEEPVGHYGHHHS